MIKILYPAIKYSKHTEKELDVVAHICILIVTAGSSCLSWKAVQPSKQETHCLGKVEAENQLLVVSLVTST